jgi:peptidoglycan glycosyltransferase
VRDDRSVARPHGLVSLEDGLVRSCNAYFAQLATYAVGASDLLETADLFGIRVAAPNTAEALADALAQAGYGQGQVLATPLQMARVVAAIANDGVLREVHWLAAKTADAGAVRVLAVGPARFLASALRRTAREGAAATVLASVAPALAGKTGTAEVASARSHSWFVGFLPAAEGPRIAFAVVIENGGYGSAGAAAVARDLAAEIAAMGLIGPRDS